MTYASEVLADSPVLYWKLDESSGSTAADSSSLGSHAGAYAGSPTLATGTVFGLPGVNLTQSGGNMSVQGFNAVSVDSTFALEILFRKDDHYPGQSPDINSLVGDLVSVSNGALLRWDGDTTTLTAYVANGSGYTTLTCTTAEDTDYHIVLDSNGTTVKLYLNGTEVDSETVTASGFNLGMQVGRSESARYANIRASNVAVYDTALGATRVAAHYAAVSAAPINLALSPATVTVTPQSLLAPINLLLSPATITVTAQPMGLPISVALSPATITVTPSPLGIGAISVALSPATITVTPQALDVARSVPLTPAVITVTAVNLTAAFLGVPPETKGMSLIAASGYATNPFSVTRTADRYRVVPASPVYSGRATGLVHVYPPEPA